MVVAVMDTGINYNHEDLQANMWRNPGEIPGNRIDDDGNGYVDDVYGIDPNTRDSDPMDENAGSPPYHGTGCAGIIGAVGNNGVGMAGVSWSVQHMGIRVTATNVTSAGFAEGYNYVLTMKQRGVNLRALNASFMTRIYTNQAWEDALAALGDAGVLAVCGAGNYGTDNDIAPWYPNSYNLPNIISVAASDQYDNLPSWSHYGRTNVDLAAPGVGITCPFGPGTNAYVSIANGTSAATPYVAGAVALLAAVYPDATAADIKEALLETVDVLPAFTGKMVSNGRLNVDRAMNRLSELMGSPPVVTSPPQSQTVVVGANATFWVAALGSRPMQYQWFSNGLALADATNTTLVLSNVLPDQTGEEYSVVVSNAFGSTNSEPAVLTVVPLLLTAQPTNQSVLGGCNASFSVSVTSTVPVTFQWQCNGTDIPTGTNLTLTLSNVQPEQAGDYIATVSNPFGAVTSHPAELEVIPFLITAQPTNRLVAAGTTVTFTVAVSSCVPVACQWQYNGTNIPKATNLTLTLTNVQPDQTGSYRVVVSNRFTSLTSELATLTVMILPTIVEQPCTQSVVRGGSVTLSVAVTDTAALPIGYRWRKGGSTYAHFLLGERVCFVTVTNVQGCANYEVIITNLVSPGTPMIRSRAVPVCALADDDGDGLADEWELRFFGATNVPPADDPDGDGLTTRQEHDADTDPTNAVSCLRLELSGPPVAAGPVALRFCAVSNKTYTVQCRAAVDTGPWNRVADVTGAPTNRVVELLDSVPASVEAQRFYRLVTPRVP